MPFTFSDQFYIIDPANPPAVGTPLAVVRFDLTDQNDDGRIGRAQNDSIDGSDITAVYTNDVLTVQEADGSFVTITGVTFTLADGRSVFTPTDGTRLDDGTYQSSSTTDTNPNGRVNITAFAPPCFVAGTRIATPGGEVAVEDLEAGQTVLASDGRRVTLRRRIDTPVGLLAQRQDPCLRPVRIARGALGQGLPRRDLRVSRQHRMLVASPIVARMFDVPEVLVAAIHLTALDGVEVEAAQGPVTYCHLIFDAHEVILADGAPSESLLGGAEVHRMLPEPLLAEVEGALDGGAIDALPARPIPDAKRQKALMDRHLRNDRPVLASYSPVPQRRASLPPAPARAPRPAPQQSTLPRRAAL